MNSSFSKKGLMVALGASVFALSSFTAVNADPGHFDGTCCLDYNQKAPPKWLGHPDLNKLGFTTPVFPPIAEFAPVSMDRFLSCYMYHFPDGKPVTGDNCKAAVGKFYPIPNNGKVEVLSAHWYPDVTLGSLRKENGYLPGDVKLLATGVELTATKNAAGGVDLTLTTTAEPGTAALLILRGDQLGNGGTEIDVACDFASGGSPYTCTDAVAADTYRAAEIEDDGSLIIYDEVTPK